MGERNSQALDNSSGMLPQVLKPFQALDALQDVGNLLLLMVQFPKLLAQLDADDLTTSNYAATLTPTSPGNILTQFNALLAKLDTDAKPAGANYAALLTAGADADLPAKWTGLLAKLDLDDNADNTYVTKNTLPFVKPLDALPRAI
jgi:hypothetical protein